MVQEEKMVLIVIPVDDAQPSKDFPITNKSNTPDQQHLQVVSNVNSKLSFV